MVLWLVHIYEKLANRRSPCRTYLLMYTAGLTLKFLYSYHGGQ